MTESLTKYVIIFLGHGNDVVKRLNSIEKLYLK